MRTHLSLSQLVTLEMHRSLVKKTAMAHPLQQLFWESTLRCNLKCQHCGSDCKVSEVRADMPFNDFCGVLDNISPHVDPHKVMVIVSGGEPLLRTDLEECVHEIYKRGFSCGLVTNGFCLTEDRFRKLRNAGLQSISVSLDGLEADHDWMRGREGSFEKAVNAIKIIAAGDIKHDIITCVNARNINSLNAIKELLVSCGAKAWRLATIFPQGRAKNNPDLKLSGEQTRYLMDFIRETRKENRIRCNFACEGFLGSYEGQVRDYYYVCSAGLTTASVLADGSISACSSIRSDYHQGNIYEDDFWMVWENRFKQYRDHNWMKTGICGDCRYFRYCQGNGIHLRDDDGNIIQCLLKKMESD